MAIIAVSGKISSGKDEVGNIIHYLTSTHSDSEYDTFVDYSVVDNGWVNQKFAGKLKDMVCMLVGCTREQLEDREFKEEELGEEWWFYKCSRGPGVDFSLLDYSSNPVLDSFYNAELIKLSPRKILQLLGTNCGRDIIHPNIWVNSLMSGYKPSTSYQMGILDTFVPSYELIGGYPNWIITDCRFPNEAKAILDKKGVIIRVNRGDGNTGNHPSETALDDYDMFNHVIDNNGTIADLVEEVKKVLVIEELYEV